MMIMLIENSHQADSVSGVRQLLGSREISGRALNFVETATQASDLGARHQLLGRALETATVLLNIDADDETIAAALVVLGVPRKELDSAIIIEAFGLPVWELISGVLRAGR